MLRLQRHGKKNHPVFWITVQAKNKCFKGRIIEKVGIWYPRRTKTVDRAIVFNKYKLRYWLGVGATPTHGVHRLLEKIEFLPKSPISFGSLSVPPKKEKTYPLDFYHKHRWALNKKHIQNTFYYDKMNKLESIIKSKMEIHQEALNE